MKEGVFLGSPTQAYRLKRWATGIAKELGGPQGIKVLGRAAQSWTLGDSVGTLSEMSDVVPNADSVDPNSHWE